MHCHLQEKWLSCKSPLCRYPWHKHICQFFIFPTSWHITPWLQLRDVLSSHLASTHSFWNTAVIPGDHSSTSVHKVTEYHSIIYIILRSWTGMIWSLHPSSNHYKTSLQRIQYSDNHNIIWVSCWFHIEGIHRVSLCQRHKLPRVGRH